MTDSHLSVEYLKRFAVGDVFIETGTYKGDSVKIALESGVFKKIHTIEINEPLYLAALETFKDNPEVECHFGDSVEIIPKLVEQYRDVEVTFWLDAHASGELVGGKTGPSPLIEELKEIADLNLLVLRNGMMVPVRPKINTHTIFIDDRRLLGTPEWGMVSEREVVDILRYINSEYYLALLDGHVPGDVLCVSRREGKIEKETDVPVDMEPQPLTPPETVFLPLTFGEPLEEIVEETQEDPNSEEVDVPDGN